MNCHYSQGGIQIRKHTRTLYNDVFVTTYNSVIKYLMLCVL